MRTLNFVLSRRSTATKMEQRQREWPINDYHLVCSLSFSPCVLLPSHLSLSLNISPKSSTRWFMSLSLLCLSDSLISSYFPESSLLLSVPHILFTNSVHWPLAFLLTGNVYKRFSLQGPKKSNSPQSMQVHNKCVHEPDVNWGNRLCREMAE